MSKPGKSTDKPSKVEQAKQASNFLRGTIAETLASDAQTFEHDDVQALKFHGIYQQDDRDRREGRDKHHMFMIRTKTPGGRMTAEQYLAMDRIAEQYTYNQSLRVTTRQAFQFHGIMKGELKKTMAALNQALMSTLAACGDVERNVMCSPAPLADPLHQAAASLADQIARQLAPATGAYYEIWLDGEKVDRQDFAPSRGGAEEEEPFYGATYLPRKFKTGIALPDDNSIDVHTQDVGLVAVPDATGRSIERVNILVGGGLGMTHRKADTFARKGSELGSVEPANGAEAVKVIASIFRDYGNRSDRRHARLKYLVDEWGIDRFREEFVERAVFELGPWIDTGPMQLNDYLGRWEQGDGKYFYGIWVENGRIIDHPERQTRTAIRRAVEQFQPRVILTPNQSVLLADLQADQVDQLEVILREHGVTVGDELTMARRYSMACPALPTCGLALAESERYLPSLIDQFEPVFAELGVDHIPLTIRMTGCPNGCARPYTADLAFVGRKPGWYDIFVGGRVAGDRLGELYAEMVDEQQIITMLRPLLSNWAAQRNGDESLGDYFHRVHASEKNRVKLTGSKDHQARLTIGGIAVDG